MAWVKLDDKVWSHPKFGALSGDAVRLWMFALCWCNQHETDGSIPRVTVRVLGGTSDAAAELCASGLWHETENGWQIHDYLDHQPSRDDLARKREAKAESGRLGGINSGKTRGSATSKQSLQKPRSKREAPASKLVEAKRTPNPTQPNPNLSFGEIDPPLPPAGGSTTEPDSDPKPKRGRKGKPPADWQPTDAHRAIASERGVDFSLEVAKFRDHEFATPRSDYDAAFRNWLRSATPQRRSGTAPRMGEPGWRRQPDGGINLDDYMTLPPPREDTHG